MTTNPKDLRLDLIAECWGIYSSAVLPDDTDAGAREFARCTFFAGVAFMFDILTGSVADLDEDRACKALSAIEAELENFSQEVADAAGVDLDVLRAQLNDEFRAKR